MPPAKQPPSVWVRGPRNPRSKPALSRERIVSEAISLTDDEGIDALSMRKLGTRLGVGATSIYWHVANKEELVELVVDEVYGELDVPDPDSGDGWRAELARCGESMRDSILRHPWIATMLTQSAMAGFGPNAMRLSEGIIGVFRTAGLSPLEADRATSAIASFVLGAAGSEAAWLQMLARTGQTEAEMLAQMMPAAEAATKDHPHTQVVLAEYAGADPEAARCETFAYGLEIILDGIEAQVDRKATAKRRRPKR